MKDGTTAPPLQRCIDAAARSLAERLETVRLAHLSNPEIRATREVS